MRIIGIDPGLSGALFWYDTDTFESNCDKLPLKNGRIDSAEMNRILYFMAPAHAFIEKIFLTGREGGQSAMTIGSNYGRLMATIEINEMTLHEVAPKVWQRALGLKGGSRAIVKQEAQDYAVKRFTLMPFLQGRSRKPHDGCTDAACIALYGQLLLEGKLSCAPKKKSIKSTRISVSSTETSAKRSSTSKDKKKTRSQASTSRKTK